MTQFSFILTNCCDKIIFRLVLSNRYKHFFRLIIIIRYKMIFFIRHAESKYNEVQAGLETKYGLEQF